MASGRCGWATLSSWKQRLHTLTSRGCAPGLHHLQPTLGCMTGCSLVPHGSIISPQASWQPGQAVSSAARAGQDLRGPALALLATMAGVSPRQAGARMRHWAGVRAALAGLGVPERAIAACKQFVAQARPHSWRMRRLLAHPDLPPPHKLAGSSQGVARAAGARRDRRGAAPPAQQAGRGCGAARPAARRHCCARVRARMPCSTNILRASMHLGVHGSACIALSSCSPTCGLLVLHQLNVMRRPLSHLSTASFYSGMPAGAGCKSKPPKLPRHGAAERWRRWPGTCAHGDWRPRS